MFALNCLLVNEDKRNVFTVEVSESKNVSFLKELIKAKKAPHLDRFAASDLIVYKITLPTDSKEADADSKTTPAATRIHLQPFEEMKDVFPVPLQKHLVHIIFEHHDGPGKSSCHR